MAHGKVPLQFATLDLPTMVGEALTVADLNKGLTAKRGHFVFSRGERSNNHCVAEDVRDLALLPAQYLELRREMFRLSHKTEEFVESACWVLVLSDNTSTHACIASDSAIGISGDLLNKALQEAVVDLPRGPVDPVAALFSNQKRKEISQVLFIHTHPTPDVYKAHTGQETSHLGPSEKDLNFHLSTEARFREVHGLPIGSFVSIVFPMGKGEDTDFFYTATSFNGFGGRCPSPAAGGSQSAMVDTSHSHQGL